MREISRTFELAGIARECVFHYEIFSVRSKKENKDTIYPENWISKEALTNIGG